MKHILKLAIILAAVTACRGVPAGPMTGASSPEAALQSFVSAAKAQDLDAMSAVWGTSKGSVRETLPRQEIERRELILMRLLCQDSHRVVAKAPGVDRRQVLRVEFTRGNNRLMRNITTISGPSDRWYVEDIEMDAQFQAFCR